ncbi:MAG: tyrosine recombinase XerC [Alphaproteobacteria bacterium]|nr:tyrosine recombinase XerC [Alphaproteobacteria bacterium]
MNATIDDWLLYLRSGCLSSGHTLAAYQQDIRQFLLFFTNYLGEELTVARATSLTLQDIRAWLADRQYQSYNRRSTARSLSAVKNFYHYLQKQKILEDHPIFGVKPPRLQKTLPRPLSVDQALDLVDTIGCISKTPWIGQRDKSLFMLIYSAGLRISEALSLNCCDVRAEEYLTIEGKGGKFRKVPFLSVVKTQLFAYLEIMPFDQTTKTAPLFCGARGKRLSSTVAEVQMRRYRNLMGLPESATPHALRHSCASHLMGASGDLRSIQELLGHVSLSTTQIYTDINQDYLMKSYQSSHPRSGKN